MTNIAHDITLGTDAEGILFRGRKAVSAVGLIGGSKHEPLIVDKGNLQEDNVMAEFAIDPVKTEDEWVGNIKAVMDAMKAKIEPLDLSLKFKPSVEFTADQLNTEQALVFGCDPDFSAWTGEMNPPIDPFEVGMLRTCGGHVHVGFEVDENDPMQRLNLVRWMDLYLGLPSILLDKDQRRRQVYGKAGAYRPKPYGVEYRTLSSFWLSNEKLQRWVFRQVHLAYDMHTRDSLSNMYGRRFGEHVRAAIDLGNVRAARNILEDAMIRLPQ